MSKSMWCDATISKPVIDKVFNPKGDVCFWVATEDRPRWGHYDETLNLWYSYEGKGEDKYVEPYRVGYFAYIENPYL